MNFLSSFSLCGWLWQLCDHILGLFYLCFDLFLCRCFSCWYFWSWLFNCSLLDCFFLLLFLHDSVFLCWLSLRRLGFSFLFWCLSCFCCTFSLCSLLLLNSTNNAVALFIRLLLLVLLPQSCLLLLRLLCLHHSKELLFLHLISFVLFDSPLFSCSIVLLDIPISKICKNTRRSFSNDWSPDRFKRISLNRYVLQLFVKTKHIW